MGGIAEPTRGEGAKRMGMVTHVGSDDIWIPEAE
jgi:hypothetical protein